MRDAGGFASGVSHIIRFSDLEKMPEPAADPDARTEPQGAFLRDFRAADGEIAEANRKQAELLRAMETAGEDQARGMKRTEQLRGEMYKPQNMRMSGGRRSARRSGTDYGRQMARFLPLRI